MQTTTTSLSESLDLFEVKPSCFVSVQQLKDWLPDMKTALWFAKVYKLDFTKLSDLLTKVFQSSVLDALMAGNHSTELQDYLVDTIPTEVLEQAKPSYVEEPPPGDVLPEIWEMAEIEVAKSIAEVADKLASTLHLLPSKEGRMLFANMARMNKLRPTIGTFEAHIAHQRVPDVLVVLDDSGSMTEETIRAIVDDVVALSWKANAHLALVSNTCRHWEPGSYNVSDVLARGEYGGTHYETLKPLFDKDWGTVITIADYDSSSSAKQALASATGRIGTVLDISLVDKPTFLAECVGQLADTVKPTLLATGIVTEYYW